MLSSHKSVKWAVTAIAVVAALMLASAAAHAQTTWHVDDDNCPGPGDGSIGNPYCLIQDAIVAAAASGDEIIVETGTYNEAALAIAISTSAAHGGVQVITFDELPLGTIVDGMVIGNVTFGFSSADATIDGGPGVTFFIDIPNIEGDAFGTLTLEFAIPVLELSYGFALSSFVPSAIGSTMEVFDPDGFSLGIFSEPAADFGFGFVEGLNSAGGVGAIGSAVITFDPTDAIRFAFDNLTMLKVLGLGACCVVDTEICTDDQAEEECDAQGGEWHVGQSCGDILCPPPPVESCGGVNESFETGDFSGWLTQDLRNPFFALQVGGAGISPGFDLFSSAPTDGSFAALHGFDGDGPGTIAVAQDFDLPAGATALEFDYRGGWVLIVGATQDRTFEVTLRPAGGGPPLQPPQLILTAEAGTVVLDTGNLVGSVDVSAHAGSTIQVSFEWFVPEFFTGPAFFQMDNIRCPVPVACPWDLNGDGEVAILDLEVLLVVWDSAGPLGDIDGDGVVGIFDLLTLIANWGPCP